MLRGVQHSGPLRRGLYAERLRPRRGRNAARRCSVDEQRFARQSETPEKERGSANQKAGTPAFLFWYGSCQGQNKNT